MSSCDLSIVLENPGSTYKFGDVVRGIVGVSVEKDCQCRGLEVTVGWYTHGSGSRADGGTTVRLFAGEWKKGDKAAHPFEIKIAHGPLPYHGHHLNVDWQVRATADIPWGFDPHAEVDLTVVDDPTVPEIFQGSSVRRGLDAASGGGIAGMFLTGFGLFFAFSGVASALFVLFMGVIVGAATGMGAGAGGSVSAGAAAGVFAGLATLLMGAVVPVIFVVIGLAIAGFGIRPILAERRFGKPSLRVEPDFLRAGDEFAIKATVTPVQTTEVTAIWAIVAAREECVSGSGTDTRHYHHTVHEERIQLCGARSFLAGAPVPLDAKARIPRNPAPSFSVYRNALEWTVEFHADLARGADVVRRYGLQVRP